jgi:hypothetical protein
MFIFFRGDKMRDKFKRVEGLEMEWRGVWRGAFNY